MGFFEHETDDKGFCCCIKSYVGVIVIFVIEILWLFLEIYQLATDDSEFQYSYLIGLTITVLALIPFIVAFIW